MPEPDSSSRFRIVRPPEAPRRPRGPGLAVIAVAVDAVLFLGALFYLRSRIENAAARPAGAPPAAPAAKAAPAPPERLDRLTLLSGEPLASDARSEYARRISEDCCDCGCDLTLRRCLATDAKCTRSSEIASRRLAEMR